MSEELRRKLQQARSKTGETQVAFAKRLGVPSPTYIKWENDQATPRGFALKELNRALDAILASK